MQNKKNILFGLSLCLAFGLASCSDDDKSTPFIQPDLEITNAKGADKVAADKELQLKAKIKGNTKGSNFYWTVNGDKVADDLVNYEDSTFNFIQDAAGKYAVGLVFEYDGQTYPTSKEITVLKSFAKGIFVLNEGALGSNGSLVYISPEGDVIADAYYEVNNMKLGDVCQDLYIHGDKLFIVSQKGNSKNEDNVEGKLVVADATTLERIDSYGDEVTDFNATHVAVLDDDNIFVNGSGAIFRFSLSTKKSIEVEGSRIAAKTRMAVVGGKVYVAAGNNILELESNKDEVARKLDLGGKAHSVIASHDNNLWVAIGNNKIAHVDVNTFKVTEAKTISMGDLNPGFARPATPMISAYKDEIYYSGAKPIIYVLNFKTGENKQVTNVREFTDDGVIYQTVQVNPKTGDAYMTTLKGFGSDSSYNNINIFKHEGLMSLGTPKQYKDLLAFPAGVYFPENYN